MENQREFAVYRHYDKQGNLGKYHIVLTEGRVVLCNSKVKAKNLVRLRDAERIMRYCNAKDDNAKRRHRKTAVCKRCRIAFQKHRGALDRLSEI